MRQWEQNKAALQNEQAQRIELQQSSAVQQALSHAVAEQAAQCSQTAQATAAALKLRRDSSTASEANAAQAALSSLCELLKVDHLLFKFRVYNVLFGLSEETVEDFADHTQCRLGRWYYEGEGKQKYQTLVAFKELELPHRRMHDAAFEALQTSSRGDQEKLVAAVAAMESHSLDLQRALEDLAHTA